MVTFPHIDDSWCLCRRCQAKRFEGIYDDMPKGFQIFALIVCIPALMWGAGCLVLLLLNTGVWAFKGAGFLSREAIELSVTGLLGALVGAAGWMMGTMILWGIYEILSAIGKGVYRFIRWLCS